MEYTKNIESMSITSDIETEFVKLILRDELFCATYIEYLSPNIFKESLRPIVEICISYWKQYGKLITNVALVQSLQFKIGVGLNKEKFAAIINTLKAISEEPLSSEFTESVLREFITAQKIENSLVASAELYKKYLKNRDYSNLEKIPDIVNESAQPIVLTVPTRIVAGIDERTEHRERVAHGDIIEIAIPTEITFLDNLTRSGGLEPGQLGLWTASTGGGKTIALIHNCYAANRNGYDAVMFTLELSGKDICDRTDSMMSGIEFSRIGEDYGLVQHKLKAVVESNKQSKCPIFGETIVIDLSSGGATVQTIKNELLKLKRNFGFEPQLIVVDYLDILGASRNKKVEEWKKQQDVARELRELANQHKVVLWTASQANRGAISKIEEDGVIGEDNIAESYAKQTVADMIVSINRKKSDSASPSDPKPMKLHVIKNRVGPAGTTREILTAYSRMSFYEGENEYHSNSSIESGAFK